MHPNYKSLREILISDYCLNTSLRAKMTTYSSSAWSNQSSFTKIQKAKKIDTKNPQSKKSSKVARRPGYTVCTGEYVRNDFFRKNSRDNSIFVLVIKQFVCITVNFYHFSQCWCFEYNICYFSMEKIRSKICTLITNEIRLRRKFSPKSIFNI